MENQKVKKKKVTMTIDQEVFNKFSQYCEENAMIKSKAIENMMRKFIEDEKKKKGILF